MTLSLPAASQLAFTTAAGQQGQRRHVSRIGTVGPPLATVGAPAAPVASGILAAAGFAATAAATRGRVRQAQQTRGAAARFAAEGEAEAEPEKAKKPTPKAPRMSPAAAAAAAAEGGGRLKRFFPQEQVGVTEPFGFWDPASFCPKDERVFKEYRACEIKHGRVAMMASLGAVAQHFVRLPGFEKTNFGEPLPAGLAAAFETPGTFGFVLLASAAGAVELTIWREDYDNREPGDFGDPLGLGMYDKDMRNKELNNGRLAMFTAMGIILAELVSGKDAIQQLGLA